MLEDADDQRPDDEAHGRGGVGDAGIHVRFQTWRRGLFRGTPKGGGPTCRCTLETLVLELLGGFKPLPPQIDTSGGLNPRTHHFYAPSEMEREEWVHVIRKHAVNSVIDNGYEIKRDEKESKLGSGSYSTVWKGVCKETRKVWAIKEMQKSAVKRDEEENLREEVRISTIVGSHSNIVYMKEFVENKDKYFIVLEYLTGGELFDRIVDAPGGHFTEKDAARIMRQVISTSPRTLHPEAQTLKFYAPDPRRSSLKPNF